MDDLNIVRNPNVFTNPDTVSEESYPIKLVDGNFCPSERNARTSPYQTYSPYSSTAQNINNTLIGELDKCEVGETIAGCLYKSREDVCGGQFFLYKDYDTTFSIKAKRELVGRLYYQINGERVEVLDTLDLTNTNVLDVEVHFDIVYIQTEDEVFIGNCVDFNFYRLGYNTNSKPFYNNGKTYIFLDNIVGEYNLYEFKNNVLKDITKVSLVDVMTSFDIIFKKNKFEVIYTDSDFNRALTLSEYDYSDGQWYGFSLPNNYPFEIVGSDYKNGNWVIFHQTDDNTIAGSQFKPLTPEQLSITNNPCEQKGDLFLTYTQEINPTLEVFEGTPFSGLGTVIKWRSIKQGSDGNLYAAPYGANSILKIDPSDDSIDFSQSTTGISTSSQKWVDGTEASNGKIYYNAHAATSGYLILDATTGPPTLTSAGLGFGHQTRGGAEGDNGVIYSPHWSGGTSVITIDTATDTVNSIPFVPDQTGPVFTDAPFLASNSQHTWHWGATKAPNGKIYGTPWGSDRIMIINPSTNIVSQGSDILTGGLPTPTSSGSPYFSKYSGGTYTPVNGHIYCFPRNAKTILKINPDDDSAIELPLPTILADQTLQKSFSSVLGPNGIVYSVPWSAPYLFWINPATDEIGYREISTEMAAGGGGTSGTGFWTYGYTVGNSIYYVPGGSFSILKLTID